MSSLYPNLMNLRLSSVGSYCLPASEIILYNFGLVMVVGGICYDGYTSMNILYSRGRPSQHFSNPTEKELFDILSASQKDCHLQFIDSHKAWTKNPTQQREL